MEPKPSPPAPAPSRRRGAATKRKERAASAAPSGAPPPKRQARDCGPVDPPSLPPKHQARDCGPVDPPSLPPPQPRSRQPARKPRRKPARKKSTQRSVKPPPRAQEVEGPPPSPPPPPPPPPPPKPLPPARPSLEKEVEAVLSRGAGVHVVPTFAGWFSWKEIHPIEKQMLATFFDGKSERRTPEIYLRIRNLIMNKFHFNPEVHLESKDLCELSIGEMDARLVILEFLAHWGLVNFHPFPPVTQERKLVESKSSAEIEDEISLVEKLFQLETVHSYLVPVSKEAEVISPVQFTSLLSEPTTLAEDAIGPAESSVEYHCNSCSVDCSRKRYHCRTQVDFDFCSECYNEGKFDEGMSKADFILMESAEVRSGGSNWTDQETLLLLEALEIFKGKEWGEIAEHVATKTKEQCMLYFLQMPISEPFLDGEDFNETPHKITEQDSEIGPSDVPDEMDVDGNAEGKESTDEKAYNKANSISSETRTKLADKNVSEKDYTMDAGGDGLVASIDDESNKSSLMDPAHKKNSANADVSGEQTSNFVIDVLRSTFEAVDHFLGQEDLGSFAEAGNPVMALAAFFASLVEHDDAVSSCCRSLRAISEISPALQLATEHCFILPDPPSDLKLKETTSTFSAGTGSECQEGADTTQNVNDTDKDSSEREENDSGLEKENAAFASQKEHLELSDTKERGRETETKSNSTKDSDNPIPKVDSSVASDKMRDGCNANAISCSATSNNATEPSSIAYQEASAVTTKDTTNPEQVEGDKQSSEELPADVSPSQRMTAPKNIEHAPASSSIQQSECKQTGNGNSEALRNLPQSWGSKLLQDTISSEIKLTSNRFPSLHGDDETEPKSSENIAANDDPIIRLQRAAGTAISAAAVKAKFLAEQEEGYIRQLAALVIEKQFQKIETKMSFLNDVENLVLRSRDLTERMRKKLMLERSMIIASRMGAAAAAASRTNQQGVPGTRLPVAYALNPQLRRP